MWSAYTCTIAVALHVILLTQCAFVGLQAPVHYSRETSPIACSVYRSYRSSDKQSARLVRVISYYLACRNNEGGAGGVFVHAVDSVDHPAADAGERGQATADVHQERAVVIDEGNLLLRVIHRELSDGMGEQRRGCRSTDVATRIVEVIAEPGCSNETMFALMVNMGLAFSHFSVPASNM